MTRTIARFSLRARPWPVLFVLAACINAFAQSGPVDFPPGGVMPPGFVGENNNGGQWSVATNVGYLSASSLRSPVTRKFTYRNCVPDYTTGDENCTEYLLSGLSQLRYSGTHLEGNVTFTYRISSDPVAAQGLVVIDDNVVLQLPGHTGWATASFPITRGEHVIRFYLVNSSAGDCSETVAPDNDGLACGDRIYIDDVSLPPPAVALNTNLFGKGTVTVSGQNDCASVNAESNSCSYVLGQNSIVNLSAMPAAGYFFNGWFGGAGCTGTGGCTLTMNGPSSANATFLEISPVIDIAFPGSGSGVVTSGKGGIHCPGSCSETYSSGENAVLTPVADAGSTFIGWYLDYFGIGALYCADASGVCTYPVTKSSHLLALFAKDTQQIDINLSGSGSGTVTSSPAGISCPGTCSAVFPRDTLVTLTFTPNAGSYGPFQTNNTGIICADRQTQCIFTLDSKYFAHYTLNFDFKAGVVPDAPVLNSLTASALRLNWSATPPANNGGQPIQYYIFKCVSATAPTALGSSIAAANFLASLTGGVLYSCTVSAVNEVGESAPSNALTGTPYPLLTLVKVSSRKVHGSAGLFFDLPLANFQGPPIGEVPVEPRLASGSHLLVLEFSHDVTSVGSVSTTEGNVSYSLANNLIFVTLDNVSDNRRVGIGFSDLISPGNQVGAFASIGFLQGDVSSSRAVTAADILGVKAHAGPVTNANFRFDLNLDGVVDSADVNIVRSRSGTALALP